MRNSLCIDDSFVSGRIVEHPQRSRQATNEPPRSGDWRFDFSVDCKVDNLVWFNGETGTVIVAASILLFCDPVDGFVWIKIDW